MNLQSKPLLLVGIIVFGLGMPPLAAKAATQLLAPGSYAAPSADGRYVAFVSTSTMLFPSSGPTTPQVYMRDTVAGTDVLVSVSTGGVRSNGQSSNATVSDDGRYVTFLSTSSDLVADDTNGVADVFRRALSTGVTTLVSTSTAGGLADGASRSPVMSADGSHVAFSSRAGNLVTDMPTNTFYDIFVRDMQAGTTSQLSFGRSGDAANGDSDHPGISGNGATVVFDSVANNLIFQDFADIEHSDVFAVTDGLLSRVSASTAGDYPANGPSMDPSISPDGRYVSFTSAASNLGENRSWENPNDVFVRQLGSSEIRLVSKAIGGGSVGGQHSSVANGGRYVTFETRGGSLITNYPNSGHVTDVYIRDVQEGFNRLVSTRSNGDGAATGAYAGRIAANASYVTFHSPDDVFMSGDTNGAVDVFRVPVDTSVPAPALVVPDQVMVEGSSGISTRYTFVALTRPVTVDVFFDVETVSGSAVVGTDLMYTAERYVIERGQTSRAIELRVVGDTDVEPEEFFVLKISNPSGAPIDDAQGNISLQNDDSPPVPVIDVSLPHVIEGNAGTTQMVYTVDLSFAASTPVSFDIATRNSSATAGVDYVAKALSGQVIPAGQTSMNFAVTINGDTAVEFDESVDVVLSNVRGAYMGSNSTNTGYIHNDDYSISVLNGMVTEGHSGSKQLAFEVLLSESASTPITFNIATANGTATAGSDYVAKSSTSQTIPAGLQSASFVVTVNGDTAVEADETFFANLSNVVGASINRGQAIGTIRNDDGASAINMSISDAYREEGNSGTRSVTFTVFLSLPASTDVVFDLATADVTATAGSDYVATALTGQRITAGATSKTFTVTINGDTTVESDENFTVNLTSVAGATVADGSAIGTITNDDVPEPGNAAPAASFSFTPARLNVSFADGSSDPDGSIVSRHWDFGDGTTSTALNPTKTYASDGTYNVVLTITDNAGASASTSRVVRVMLPVALMATDQYLWMVPPASSTQREGFLRLTNRQNGTATVSVWGLDSVGRRSAGTITLTLAVNESRQFNSTDLELGSAAKGLTGGIGEGFGDWTIIVRSSADIEALAYIRTPDGFLTSMHDRADGDGVDWFVPAFNPAENPNQVSHLRVINTNTTAIDLILMGVDDAGAVGLSEVVLSVPALSSVDLSSSDLENGNTAKGLVGRLGNGTGKWHLSMSSTGRISVQSLLSDPLGKLTNLSTLPDLSETTPGERVLWFVPSASSLQQQGFVRLINRENRAGTLALWGIDDTGQRSPGIITMPLAARESKQLNSLDLEFGNPSKGITGSLGNGTGNWRLVALTDLDLIPLAFIRTPDGFLTTVHETVAGDGLTLRVPIFNPAENPNQVSVLRIVNPNASAATVSVRGVDDLGAPGPGGALTVTVAAGAAIELSATDLETGNASKGLSGSLGNGAGKWALTMTATVPLKVLNLLRDPRGYLTNLSTSSKGADAKLEP